jgi:hypothetical protein
MLRMSRNHWNGIGAALVLAILVAVPALAAHPHVAGGGHSHLGPPVAVGGLQQDGAAGADGSVYLPNVAGGLKQQDDRTDEERAIGILVQQPKVARHLASYAGWRAEADLDEGSETVWNIDLYKGDEWIGWGKVDLSAGEVVDYYVPLDLTPEEFAAGKEKIEKFLTYDPEVKARLGEPSLWGHEVAWNRWDQQWQAWYWYGIDALVVVVTIDETTGTVYLDAIHDANDLEAEDKAEADRNRAIEIAYGADGIDDALAGFDAWRTYVEDQGQGRYTVAFVNGDRTLLAVLVDIVQGIVLGTQP